MKYYVNEKISVIAIVYNVEKYIEECVNSIILQTYENLEIILVDDGSNDKTGERCDEFARQDNRIKVLHKPNGGLVSARQAGIKVATGKYAAFIDGDDWVDSDMYEKLFLVAQLFEADIVLSGLVREFSNNKVNTCNAIGSGFYDKTKLIEEIYPNMMYSAEKHCPLVEPSLCNKLFLTHIIRESLLQVDKKIFYLGEDAATTFPCILKANSIYVTDFCMYHHRIISGNKEDTYKRDRVFERLFLFYENLHDNFNRTSYSLIMEKQLTGYFLYLLNNIVGEKIGADINLFYQCLYTYGKESQIMKKCVRFKVPFEELKEHTDIILYGAGGVGREYYNQISNSNINIVSWVDKDYMRLRKSGLSVSSIEDVKNKTYDSIILSAKTEELANNMKKELVDMGILETLIKWVKPIVAE